MVGSTWVLVSNIFIVFLLFMFLTRRLATAKRSRINIYVTKILAMGGA